MIRNKEQRYFFMYNKYTLCNGLLYLLGAWIEHGVSYFSDRKWLQLNALDSFIQIWTYVYYTWPVPIKTLIIIMMT